jgi:hypothetical protein
MEVTVEQFAHWSFERDRQVGLYPNTKKFNKLPADERQSYMDEAKFYIDSVPRDNWPEDILERLKN